MILSFGCALARAERFVSNHQRELWAVALPLILHLLRWRAYRDDNFRDSAVDEEARKNSATSNHFFFRTR